MSFRVLLGVAGAAATAVAVAIVIISMRGTETARPAPGSVVATHNPSPGATNPSEYWTEERMKDAIGG